MAHGQLSPVQRLLRRVRAEAPGARSDGHFLSCFLEGGDQAAFTALVQRHGPMVLSVCRRVLSNLPDAEDAFQATFLVLAKKAASIRKQGSLASWLYGVAYRIARKVQVSDSRRRIRESQAPQKSDESSLPESAWRELRAILDEELDRLPEKYRSPLVFCYLEGKTNEEAAQVLGWTKGTVSGRLACARDLLRKRLTRRGLALSAGMLVGLFGAGTAPAAVPGALQAATVQAAAAFAAGKAALSASAAALAEGVIQAMFVTKCKIMLSLALVVGLVAGGGGVLAQHLAGANETGPQQELTPVASIQAEPNDVQPPAKDDKEPDGERNLVRDRMTSMNNLKQIALAMHNYHDAYNGLPAQAIYSKDGKPLLSWRVAILPFIEEENLYRQFKLKEPWDSAHNKKLLSKMPAVYAPPGIKTKEKYTTFYRVFAGPGTVFEGKKGVMLRDIKDGTSNTILVVEAGQAVPWTKPDELPFDAKKKNLPGLGGIFGGNFNMALADGSVHYVAADFDKDIFRAMITRSGGEVVDINKLNKTPKQ